MTSINILENKMKMIKQSTFLVIFATFALFLSMQVVGANVLVTKSIHAMVPEKCLKENSCDILFSELGVKNVDFKVPFNTLKRGAEVTIDGVTHTVLKINKLKDFTSIKFKTKDTEKK